MSDIYRAIKGEDNLKQFIDHQNRPKYIPSCCDTKYYKDELNKLITKQITIDKDQGQKL